RGRRPRAELLAVVTHRSDPLAVLGGVVAQVVDDLVDVPERDPIAEALLGPEDAQEPALVVGRIRAPMPRLGDGRGAEMGVIQDGPVVATEDERGGQVRLPDTLRQTRASWPATEHRLELRAHPAKLPDPVAV